MLLCMCNPLLVWVSLLSATILSGVIFTTLMLEEHFEHNLPRDEVRMSGVYRGAAAIIGSLLAIPASGPLISLSIRYFTLRNGGTRHAEVYLPGFVLPVLSSALCQVLLAMGSSSGSSAVLYYVSYGLCMFSYVSGEVAVVLWIIEAFPPWASASLAVQYFVRDMVAFGIGINLMAWVKKEVNVQSSLVILVLVLVIGALAVPIVFWGKTVRQYIHGKWSESTKGAIRPRTNNGSPPLSEYLFGILCACCFLALLTLALDAVAYYRSYTPLPEGLFTFQVALMKTATIMFSIVTVYECVSERLNDGPETQQENAHRFIEHMIRICQMLAAMAAGVD
ncbi:hypothetical protein BN1723_007388 [Verticillium longisporum]|nr:hypothetical protein BN1723_007388 [Verticillium longisporum]